MRLIARFAQEKDGFFEVITVYDEKTVKEYIDSKDQSIESISVDYPAASWFERKISDDFGIQFSASVDNNFVMNHPAFPENIFPLSKQYTKPSIAYVTKEVACEREGYTTLGPTQPFHLESIQFQALEEEKKISSFKSIPFYKHRGIEKMVEGLEVSAAGEIIERISAPQTVAYQIAFLDIKLQASKKILPEMIRKRHMFLLEYERIMNHIDDLSLLSLVIGFKDAAIFFSNYLEKGRDTLFNLTGHRFGFNSIRLDTDLMDMEEINTYLFSLERDMLEFEQWIEKREAPLVKMKQLGCLSEEIVKRYGVVGPVARSCKVELDRRKDDKAYESSDFIISLEDDGDTFARFNIRITEILSSLRMMKNMIKNNILPFNLGTVADGEYYAYVESSAGELMMYMAIKGSVIERFFVRDPSFLTVQILEESIIGSDVSAIAPIIKSMPLHISAIDL